MVLASARLRNICIYSKRKYYCVERLLVYVTFKILLDLSRSTRLSVGTICISKEDIATKARVVSYRANLHPSYKFPASGSNSSFVSRLS
jgi:hypothetical protein